jgi:hypothetical protein
LRRTASRLKKDFYCVVTTTVDPDQYDLYNSIDDIQPHSYVLWIVKYNLIRYAWMFSGIAAFIACFLSFYLIYQHLKNFNKPNIQKHIVRILVMVPVYAIDSWFSFRFYRYGVYFDVLRDTYEGSKGIPPATYFSAFVIYEFVIYLIELLGGHEATLLTLQSKEAPIQLPMPLCKIKLNPKTK